MIRYILITLATVIFSGCSSNQIRNSADNLLQKTSGNKPPKFFMFTDQKTSDGFILNHDRFSVKAPLTYQKDWQKMSGWFGGLIYSGGAYGLSQYDYININGTKHRRIALKYEIDIATSITPYAERESS